uniref:EB domain-containing protein n=1 Tax=Magallana gigas TaxID=29159 RepID=K1Q6G3_MAGGI
MHDFDHTELQDLSIDTPGHNASTIPPPPLPSPPPPAPLPPPPPQPNTVNTPPVATIQTTPPTVKPSTSLWLPVSENTRSKTAMNEQCKGITNANTCQYKEGEEGVCSCDKEYSFIIGECLKDKINLDDMCEINLQCSGTENAGVCGKNQTCTCDEGFIRSKEGCLPVRNIRYSIVDNSACGSTAEVG